MHKSHAWIAAWENGIGDVVVGTTPVTIIKHTLSHNEGFHLLTLADDLVLHQVQIPMICYGVVNSVLEIISVCPLAQDQI